LFVNDDQFLFDPDNHLFAHPDASQDCRLVLAGQLHCPDHQLPDASLPLQADSSDQQAPEAAPLARPDFATDRLLHLWNAPDTQPLKSHSPNEKTPTTRKRAWRF
jgi:hypothetical protein